MKKILIGRDNYSDYLENETFIVSKEYIVSPVVFDILEKQKINILYQSDLDLREETLNLIEKILIEEYKLVDRLVIENVKNKIMSILN